MTRTRTPVSGEHARENPSPVRPTRRQVLKTGVGGAVALGAASTLTTKAFAAPVAVDDLRFLITRATWGYSEAEYQYAQSIGGYTPWLDEQLSGTLADGAYDAFEAGSFPVLAMTPTKIVCDYAPGTFSRAEYVMARITRATWSKRQLEDQMVQFWLDLMNINILDPGQWYHLIRWYEDTIRPHALSTFPNLLAKTANGPAMMAYLNNDQNVVGGPNENYARELMELHAMGTEYGGYDENDVKALARLLTGWTWHMDYDATDCDDQTALFGSFDYDDTLHDTSAVDLWVGKNWERNYSFPTTESDGIDAITTMATTPVASLYIAKKLVQHFLRDDVDEQDVFAQLIVPVAIAFQNSGGDIKTTLRAVFDRSRIAMVDPENEPKFQTPMRYTVGCARALRVPLPANAFPPSFSGPAEYSFSIYLNTLGEAPQTIPSPDGPTNDVGRLADGTRDRIVFVNDLCDNLIGGYQFGSAELFALFGRQVALNDLAQHANVFLTGGTLDPLDVSAAQGYVASKGYTGAATRRMIALLLSCSSYQRMKG